MQPTLMLQPLPKRPKISVIITAYGRPQGLNQTIESIAHQTIAPDQIVIYDDASPVDPSDLVLSWRSKFLEFHYMRQSRNVGMPTNLNQAISQATGDIIVNLHDGDIYDPSLLATAVDRFRRYPSAGLVFWSVSTTTGAFRSSQETTEMPYAFCRSPTFRERIPSCSMKLAIVSYGLSR